MPSIPKIKNPLEDDFDSIDFDSLTGIVKNAQEDVSKHIVQQVKPSDIVDYLYGVSPHKDQDASSATHNASNASAAASDAGQEKGTEQLSQALPHQAVHGGQQKVDPTKMMTAHERKEYTEQQKKKREEMRVHERNYFTFPTLDQIGTLEERIRKLKRQRDEEDEQRKKEEEEEKERKKREEEEKKKQSVALPSGKKSGVPPDVLRRQQNKTEQNRGQSG